MILTADANEIVGPSIQSVSNRIVNMIDRKLNTCRWYQPTVVNNLFASD